MRGLLLIPFLTSCAPSSRRYQYKDYAIVVESAYEVDKYCRPERWDSGRIPRWNEHAAACWDPNTREIHTRDNCDGAKNLIHELAHKDGVADPENSGYEWENFNGAAVRKNGEGD